jgi:hypothetical protein
MRAVSASPHCQSELTVALHPGPALVTNTILAALHTDQRFDVEFLWETQLIFRTIRGTNCGDSMSGSTATTIST